MRPPLHRLKKSEICWLGSHTCLHRHTYLDHYACYLQDRPQRDRLGFFDIESYGLTADYGVMLAWSIKAAHGKIRSDILTAKDLERVKTGGDEDRRLVETCVAALQDFDEIVTYYGNDYRFDVPFVRTRAVSLGIPFPHYGTIRQTDLYPVMKKKFRLSRNRQENATRTLLGSTEKTHLDGATWRAAARGHKQALAYILDHNHRDVRDLERLYWAVVDFVRRQDTSL